jgi:2,4-dienoyl-CoA reductase (NADPH2)
MYPELFTPISVQGISLPNRLTMAPTYLGYAGEGGTVSPMLLDHYRLMAGSGVAMVVVENATVDAREGSGSPRTLRADTDENLEGLSRLAAAIREKGALACAQINHAGRFAGTDTPLAPSAVGAFGRTPRAMDAADIQRVVERFAAAARRIRDAGFDMVELHGGTGYLLAQFLSPRTNRRTDGYGGSPENRRRFPLEVFDRVKAEVGDFPVGYRFMADEWLPDGLDLEAACPFAEALAGRGAAYLSVMGGTYESFVLPEVVERSRKPGYMLDLAAAVKRAVDVPVIAAGRISGGKVAAEAVRSGKADLIGLARVLWADPEWPRKVEAGREEEIVHCDPECDDACTRMVMKGRPAYCVRWTPEKTKTWKEKFS